MAQASEVKSLSPDIIEVSRMIPEMSEAQLGALRNTPYGFLASIEVSRRNRIRLQQDAQKSTSGETVFDSQLRMLRQRQLQEALAADERVGLNNIVAQAEQGGLEFGQPTEQEPAEMAGGGIVAFDGGGKVPGFAFGALVPAALAGARALGPLAMRGVSGLRGLATKYPKTAAGTAITTPFGFIGLGDEEKRDRSGTDSAIKSDEYPDESRRGSGSYLKGPKDSPPNLRTESEGVANEDAMAAALANRVGGAGIKALDLETDPRKLIELRRQLEKEQGLGEFGAKAKEIREGRKGRVEEVYGRALESEPFLAAAEAAGSAKPTGRRGLAGLLDVAAPAVAAAGKSAAGIGRQKADAMDKLAEGEERLALAEEQYLRGNVGDAMTQSRQAKKDMFEANTKLREIAMKETYYGALGLAAKAKAGGTFKLGDVTKASEAIANMQQQIRMLDPKKQAADIAELQRLIRILKGGIGVSYARGTGASIEDTED